MTYKELLKILSSTPIQCWRHAGAGHEFLHIRRNGVEMLLYSDGVIGVRVEKGAVHFDGWLFRNLQGQNLYECMKAQIEVEKEKTVEDVVRRFAQ
jgi:hypothetical protein